MPAGAGRNRDAGEIGWHSIQSLHKAVRILSREPPAPILGVSPTPTAAKCGVRPKFVGPVSN